MSTEQDSPRTRAGADQAPARGRGRPRSEEAHQAILGAVIELLGEHGLNGLTIEAVAARAGVGKTTIYRRWDSKEELVIEALERLRPSADALPDTGSLLGDINMIVTLQRERLDASQLPRIMPRVLGEAMEDPELHAAIVSRAVQPIREVLGVMVRRAIDRGELRDDIDAESLVDVLHAVPIYKLLMSGGDMDSIRDVPSQVIPLLLEGVGTANRPSPPRRRARPAPSRAGRPR